MPSTPHVSISDAPLNGLNFQSANIMYGKEVKGKPGQTPSSLRSLYGQSTAHRVDLATELFKVIHSRPPPDQWNAFISGGLHGLYVDILMDEDVYYDNQSQGFLAIITMSLFEIISTVAFQDGFKDPKVADYLLEKSSALWAVIWSQRSLLQEDEKSTMLSFRYAMNYLTSGWILMSRWRNRLPTLLDTKVGHVALYCWQYLPVSDPKDASLSEILMLTGVTPKTDIDRHHPRTKRVLGALDMHIPIFTAIQRQQKSGDPKQEWEVIKYSAPLFHNIMLENRHKLVMEEMTEKYDIVKLMARAAVLGAQCESPNDLYDWLLLVQLWSGIVKSVQPLGVRTRLIVTNAAREVWYRTLHDLRTLSVPEKSTASRKRALEVWQKFGAELELDEAEERSFWEKGLPSKKEAIPREDPVYCTWKQCQFHRKKPPHPTFVHASNYIRRSISIATQSALQTKLTTRYVRATLSSLVPSPRILEIMSSSNEERLLDMPFIDNDARAMYKKMIQENPSEMPPLLKNLHEQIYPPLRMALAKELATALQEPASPRQCNIFISAGLHDVYTDILMGEDLYDTRPRRDYLTIIVLGLFSLISAMKIRGVDGAASIGNPQLIDRLIDKTVPLWAAIWSKRRLLQEETNDGRDIMSYRSAIDHLSLGWMAMLIQRNRVPRLLDSKLGHVMLFCWQYMPQPDPRNASIPLLLMMFSRSPPEDVNPFLTQAAIDTFGARPLIERFKRELEHPTVIDSYLDKCFCMLMPFFGNLLLMNLLSELDMHFTIYAALSRQIRIGNAQPTRESFSLPGFLLLYMARTTDPTDRGKSYLDEMISECALMEIIPHALVLCAQVQDDGETNPWLEIVNLLCGAMDDPKDFTKLSESARTATSIALRKVWFPTLQKLRTLSPAAETQAATRERVLEVWSKFGALTGLDEAEERAHWEQAGGVATSAIGPQSLHCYWQACEFHLMESPHTMQQCSGPCTWQLKAVEAVLKHDRDVVPPPSARRLDTKYKATPIDMDLRGALHEFWKERMQTKHGAALLKNLGLAMIMSNDILQRIVDAVHAGRITSIGDLKPHTPPTPPILNPRAAAPRQLGPAQSNVPSRNTALLPALPSGAAQAKTRRQTSCSTCGVVGHNSLIAEKNRLCPRFGLQTPARSLPVGDATDENCPPSHEERHERDPAVAGPLKCSILSTVAVAAPKCQPLSLSARASTWLV
ncbi:hypothetical protein EW146_g6414 [Bondarzewia mesenterica]|uniref:Uncharacterized protein n=1 Tax=Bondarzewia mesenterica TaxID=1095465 RepID=A0A4S4LQH6_9AGAM|nr:hypothetical protein EW146_g6414 [Bondarzewia mesenterica]